MLRFVVLFDVQYAKDTLLLSSWIRILNLQKKKKRKKRNKLRHLANIAVQKAKQVAPMD